MYKSSDKEEIILGSLVKKSSLSQRELSRSTGISLGLINLIMKKFIKTGYIQISHLNKKKVDYLLTPDGLLYVAKKTYRYANNTIKSFQQIQSNLLSLLKGLYESGYTYFSIHGDGELSKLIESTFEEALKETPAILGTEHRKNSHSIVLKVSVDPLGPNFKGESLDVHERLGL